MNQKLLNPYFSESLFSSKFSSESFSLFGNLDYFINKSLKFSIGARWENYESQYVDSLDELFNPSDKMSGGKFLLIKI